MNEIKLQNKDGKILVSSRDVAEKFGKKHAEIIYAIEGRADDKGNIKNNGLLMSGISQLSQMFIKSEYKDSMSRNRKEYLMDRDGFSLLVMGFTGKEALRWKLKYIDAFNKMEEKLKSGDYLSEEEKLKLQLFSKDPLEVTSAYNRLIELKTAPLLEKIDTQNETIKEQKDTINEQENKLRIQKPFVQAAMTLQKMENTVSMEQASKLLSDDGIDIGRNNLMKLLREKGVLMENNSPYQKYMDRGLFKVKIAKKESHYGVRMVPVTRVTGKGLIFLNKKLREWFDMEELDIDI